MYDMCSSVAHPPPPQLPYNIRAQSHFPFDSLFDSLTRSVLPPLTLPHTDTGCIRNKPETMMATKQPANQRRDLGAVWEDSHSNNKCALNSLQSKAINNKLVAGSGGPIPIPHVDVQFRLHRLELINHYCIMTIKYNTISHSIKYNLCELLIWLIWTGWWVLDQLRAAPLRRAERSLLVIIVEISWSRTEQLMSKQLIPLHVETLIEIRDWFWKCPLGIVGW